MANSLYPGFVVIDYHSVWAAHRMTVPTRVPSYASIGTVPTYEPWAGGSIDGDDMVENLMDGVQDAVDSGVVLDGYTIYHVPTVGAVPLPVYAKAYPLTGTSGETGWAQASQKTFTFRTESFGIAKIVLLDSAGDGAWGKYYTPGTPEAGLVTKFMLNTNAWSGRDGARPAVLKNITVTLNETLRRQYNLA